MPRTQASINWTPIVLVGVGMYAVDKFFGKDDEEEEQEKTAKENTTKVEKLTEKKNPFSFSTFRKPKLKKGWFRQPTKASKLREAARAINAGIGIVYDDEATIKRGINTARTKWEIAIISAFYDRDYKKDLYTHLKQNLNATELGDINKRVLQLPDYLRLRKTVKK